VEAGAAVVSGSVTAVTEKKVGMGRAVRKKRPRVLTDGQRIPVK
jgi:hypothetical protein